MENIWYAFAYLCRSLHDHGRAKGLSPLRIVLQKAVELIGSRRLESVLRTLVKRPKRPIRSKEAAEEEAVLVEVLTVQVEVVREDMFAKFDVYINDDFEHDPFNERTRASERYAGSFTTLAHRSNHKDKHDHHVENMVIDLKLPIGKLIEDIGAANDDYVEVVLVPRAGKDAIVIKNDEVEFL